MNENPSGFVSGEFGDEKRFREWLSAELGIKSASVYYTTLIDMADYLSADVKSALRLLWTDIELWSVPKEDGARMRVGQKMMVFIRAVTTLGWNNGLEPTSEELIAALSLYLPLDPVFLESLKVRVRGVLGR